MVFNLEEELLEDPLLLKTPIVRNGKDATIGYEPDVWKGWEWKDWDRRLDNRRREFYLNNTFWIPSQAENDKHFL